MTQEIPAPQVNTNIDPDKPYVEISSKQFVCKIEHAKRLRALIARIEMEKVKIDDLLGQYRAQLEACENQVGGE